MMINAYAEALQQITKAASLQEVKVIAWTVLTPIPESLKKSEAL